MYIDNKEVKVVPSYPNYAAAFDGTIYRISSGKRMTPREHEIHGYHSYYIRICHNNKAGHAKAHRMVCEAWHGEPPTSLHTDVNHIDGDSSNNCADNLEWVTKSQNQRHAIETGLRGRGGELYNATLSEDQVHEICSKLSQGARTKDLYEEYGTSHDVIKKIKAGDTYFHIRVLYDIPHDYKNCLSEATVKWVCSKIVEGYSDKGIAEISTNPKVTAIETKRIRYKIRYKYISDNYF